MHKRKKASGPCPEAFIVVGSELLLAGGSELCGDEAERRVQLGAEALDGRNDGDRAAGRDQAVFDGGCARIVFHEAINEVIHLTYSCVYCGCLSSVPPDPVFARPIRT